MFLRGSLSESRITSGPAMLRKINLRDCVPLMVNVIRERGEKRDVQTALKGAGGGNAPSSACAAVLPDSGARSIDPIWHRCPADRHPDRVSTEAVVAQIYPATEYFCAPSCESAHRRHSVRQTNGKGRKDSPVRRLARAEMQRLAETLSLGSQIILDGACLLLGFGPLLRERLTLFWLRLLCSL